MESSDETGRVGFKAIKLRIANLLMRDDLATTAIAGLEVLSRQTDFTDDDLWFLEKIEERYSINQ